MLYHILSQLSFITSWEVSKTDIIIFYVDKCGNRLSRQGGLSTYPRSELWFPEACCSHLDPKHMHDLHKSPPTWSNLSYTVRDPNSISGILWLQNPGNVGLCVPSHFSRLHKDLFEVPLIFHKSSFFFNLRFP